MSNITVSFFSEDFADVLEALLPLNNGLYTRLVLDSDKSFCPTAPSLRNLMKNYFNGTSRNQKIDESLLAERVRAVAERFAASYPPDQVAEAFSAISVAHTKATEKLVQATETKLRQEEDFYRAMLIEGTLVRIPLEMTTNPKGYEEKFPQRLQERLAQEPYFSKVGKVRDIMTQAAAKAGVSWHAEAPQPPEGTAPSASPLSFPSPSA